MTRTALLEQCSREELALWSEYFKEDAAQLKKATEKSAKSAPARGPAPRKPARR